MIKVKKHYFLFLELIFTFTILTLAIIPLVSNPLNCFRSEINILERSECERIAALSYAQIKESLYLNALPWSSIPPKTEPEIKIPLPPYILNLDSFGSRSISRYATIKTINKKDGAENTEYRLLKITIHLKPSSTKKDKNFIDFPYVCMAKKVPIEE